MRSLLAGVHCLVSNGIAKTAMLRSSGVGEIGAALSRVPLSRLSDGAPRVGRADGLWQVAEALLDYSNVPPAAPIHASSA